MDVMDCVCLSEIELSLPFVFVAFIRSPRISDGGLHLCVIMEEKGVPGRSIDLLQLDYRLITDTFGGPFQERHYHVTLDDQKDAMTLR